MNNTFKALMGISTLAFGVYAAAQVTLHENEGFQGRSLSLQQSAPNLQRSGFNDRASSAIVVGQRWQACQDAQFGGHCVVLRPGQYPSLSAMGLNDRISSMRPVRR